MICWLYSKWLAAMAFCAFVQYADAQTFCTRAGWIKEKMMTEHLQPVTNTDSLSQRIFERFFDQADPRRIYFSRQDQLTLASYRSSLVDDINNGRCEFLNKVQLITASRASHFGRFADSVLRKTMQFTGGAATKSIIGGEEPVAADHVDLATAWMVFLKSEVLNTIFRQHLLAGTSEELTVSALRSLESNARERVLKKIIRLQKFNNSPAELESYLGESFLRAIPLAFDPHSEFFTTAEMKAFMDALSPEELSFGIELEEGTLGELKVSRLVPGGPAWQSNQVNQGDVIVDVTANNEKHDFFDLTVEEGNQLLRSSEFSRAEITLRKMGGEFRKVSLTKAKVSNSDNLVFGLVLKGEKTLGYISLPGFFSASQAGGTNGCANAVIQEIIKLKREKIDGLILDLRYNGGGDVAQAVDLAGAFIDVGPVGIFENRKAGLITLKDVNRGSAYVGPLIVMVNGASASASELVAAALQDYRRAVIIGTTTYGKATAQSFTTIHQSDNTSGYLKITDEGLYRINGRTTQRQGVTPDVLIPDLTMRFVRGESALAYAIKKDSTKKKVYYQALSGVDCKILQSKSEARVAASDMFNGLTRWEKLFSNPLPLDEKDFCVFVNALRKNDEALPPAKTFKVLNASSNFDLLEVDQYQKALNQEFIQEISKSMYVAEAYNIMLDLLQLKK